MIRRASQWLSLALLAGLLVTTVARPADAIEVERGEALFLLPIAALLWLCCGSFLGDEKPPSRGLWCHALVWLTVAWVACAAVAVAGVGNLRQAINETWWWVTAALVFSAARRVLATREHHARMLILIVGLASGLASFAAHQQWISLPADRARFEADPDAFLATAGQVAPEGSAQRALLVGRLYEGGPTATFALANSLAGYLAVGVLLAAGLAISGWRGLASYGSTIRFTALGTAGLAGAMCLGALVWTHSNSANLGLLVGAGVAGATLWSAGRVSDRTFRLGVAGCGIAVLAGLVVAVGWTALWTHVPRSLRFRLEYWHATLALVREHPWFGAGPGNFQERYPRYRLDVASESIADPHNFLMEILATGGLPALLLALAAAGVGIRLLRRPGAGEMAEGGPAAKSATAMQSLSWAGQSWAIGVGAWLAFVAVVWNWVAQRSIPNFDATCAALLATVLVWFGLRPLAGFARGASPLRWAFVFGAAVLMGVHWLAAGGWTVPGLAVMWLVLVAMLLAESSSSPPATDAPNWKRWALRGAAAAGLVAVWLATAWLPVNEAQESMAAGERDYTAGRLRQAEESFAEGARSDPWDPLPTRRRSEALLWILLREPSVGEGQGPSQSQLDAWREALDETISRNPASPQVWLLRGEQQLTLYQRFGGVHFLEAARDDLRRAVELAPGQVQAVAQWAVVEQALGDREQAARLWQRAEFLASAGEHTERHLDHVQVIPAEILGPRIAASGAIRVPAAKGVRPL